MRKCSYHRPIKSGVVCFCLVFLCFVCNCSAWDIKPYPKQIVTLSAILNKLVSKITRPDVSKSDFDRSRLNLVFCPLNYQSSEVFSKDVEILTRKLKETKPFDEINAITFWRVFVSKSDENTIFQSVQGFPPLKVRRDFAEDISKRLNSGYKLIIVDFSGSVSCAEVASKEERSLIILGRKKYTNDNRFARGFLHELGHSLGLRDECANCPLFPAGKPNCAATKKEAKAWWGDLADTLPQVKYFSGCCGNAGYIRPTVISLMNDTGKSGDYGPVNERYLKELFSTDPEVGIVKRRLVWF